MRFRLRLYGRLFLVEALRALTRHKGRAALTALGCMIGVATLIWVVSVGEAGKAQAEVEMWNLGENLVWIEAGSRNVSGARTGTHGTNTLTHEDAEAIRREMPLIKSASENLDDVVQVVNGNRNWTTKYRGVSPEFVEIRHWRLAAGEFFSDDQVKHLDSVVVLGEVVRQKLFGAADPVGQRIRISNMSFLVIGHFLPKGMSATGKDEDDAIFMPWTTAQKKLRGRDHTWLDDIFCSAWTKEAVLPAIAEVTALLRQRHHIRPGQEDDFNIRRPDELIKAAIQESNTLGLLLTALASISLLIGGIGIMNVMLASVMQRTHEVGIRMAVGASPLAIQIQFLGEAVILSLLGGALGVPLSMISSFLIVQQLGWTVSLSWKAAALAVGCSVFVGVAAGTYPAWKASRLDPMTVLRAE